MSNLLEQAIIDAAALRETALKSAEATLVEKYKDEFKESVEKLLEQEDAAAPPPEAEPPPADMSANPADPNAAKPGGEAFNEVPSLFFGDDDEDEVITIEFDMLDKKDEEEASSSEAPEVEAGADLAPPLDQGAEEPAQLTEFVELDEEILDEYDQSKDMTEDALYEEETESQEELEEEESAEAEGSQEELEEEIEISEEELKELEESYVVDLKPENQLRGWMGTNSREKKISRDIDLAAARDEKATEKREKEEKIAKDLECKLEESQEENKKLNILVEELKDNLISLKEHVEKLSVSNAKLLYINKVFGNNSLNERQKQSIVENISNAKSVLEAKTIYGTLQSAVQSVSEKKPKESLSEALIRGNSGFISRPQSSSTDENFTKRMKILAGIANNN